VQLLAIPQDAEGVRTDAVTGRLDDGEGNRRRKRRVNGIAAALKHAEPGLGGERL
jgi:hypothetical protein